MCAQPKRASLQDGPTKHITSHLQRLMTGLLLKLVLLCEQDRPSCGAIRCCRPVAGILSPLSKVTGWNAACSKKAVLHNCSLPVQRTARELSEIR